MTSVVVVGGGIAGLAVARELAGAGAEVTVLSAFARPTSLASSPASASDSVVTGFFFAAMIPLNEG